jgi:hypothetical protein
MNTSNQLIIGIILIGSGLVFALIAYWILSDRRTKEDAVESDVSDEAHLEGDEEKTEGTEGDEALPEDDEEKPNGTEADDELPEEDEEEPEETDMGSLLPEEADDEETGLDEEPSVPEELDTAEVAVDLTDVEEDAEIAVAEEAPTPDQSPEPPSGPRTTLPVADLLRDEVTGALIVRVGDHEYLTPDELRNSEDWTRIEYAASDLAEWIARATTPDRGGVMGTEERTATSQSMIEQINEILQKSLIDATGELKALRLVEGPSGAVRVLMGVRSFSLDEVPDDEARQLIRDAVAEWEGRQ